MKKRHHRRLRLLVLMVLVFFFLMSHAFLKFEKTFFGMQLSQKQEELEKTAEIKAESIQKKYETMISSLQALAENMNGWETIYEEEIMQQLVLLAKVGYFDYVGISDADGNVIDSNSRETNIKNREYFQDAMGGKVSISDVLFSQVRKGEEIQVIAVPIPDGDRSSGTVFGIVNVGTMDKLLENETGTGIYTQIVDSQGNYITNVKTKDALIKYKNVWDDFAECEFLDGSIEKIREDMQQKESGSFSFRMGKEERVSFYTPLGVKGYYVFSNINSDYIREWADKTNEEVFYMVLEMGAAFFLLLMDIDHFKQINDTFGHRFGDQVLKDISGILQKKFRRDDILGRLGGDEFVVFMINAAEYEIMEPVLEDLCRKLKKTYTKDGKSVTISASFGIVEAPKYGKTFHELYEKSDRMLYEVKKNTKNGFKNYREESEVKR